MSNRSSSRTRLAWLSAHPERTEEWLSFICAQGFDIHHIDENPDNDDPNNLILVEVGDHYAVLHGKLRAIRTALETRRQAQAERSTKGEKAYLLRQLGLVWSEIDAFLQVNTAGAYARAYALTAGLAWPIPLKKATWARQDVRPFVAENIAAISAILGREASPDEVRAWNEKYPSLKRGRDPHPMRG